MRYLNKLVFPLFLFSFINGQSVRLNEIVSSNGDNLYDEDGDTPDWIELHNPTAEAIDIAGWYLSDSSENLRTF